MSSEISEGLQPELTNAFGETYLYGVNGSLFANIDSSTIYSKRFHKKYLKETSLYIVAGTDSGLLISYLLKDGIPKGTKLIFVELDEVAKWIQSNQTLPELSSSVAITTLDDLTNQLSLFNVEDYSNIDGIFSIQSYAALDFHYHPYQGLELEVRKLLEKIHWNNSISLKNNIFFENQLINIQDNINHASALYNKFPDQKALLLAGGPSLDDAIPWIKKNQNRFVIIAVSRISRRLHQADITPDIIFSIDPKPLSFDHSREMLLFSEEVLFINAYHVSPPLLAQWSGRSAYLGALFPWETKLNVTERQPEGSTVTNVALDTAILMGFSEIILCGVDLCYSPKGISHASGSKNDELGPRIEGSETTAETYAGNIADTTFAYKIAAEHLAYLAEKYSYKNCSIVNTSKNAIKLEKIPLKGLDEIDNDYKGFEQKNLLKEFGLNIDIPLREKHLNSLKTEIDNTKKTLNNIMLLSKKALEENELLIKKGRNFSHIHIEKINKIEEKLKSTEYAHISKLIKTYGVKNFLKALTHLKLSDKSNSKNWTTNEVYQGFKGYYSAFKSGAEDLLELISQSEHRVILRQEEIKASPDFNLLIEGCKKDNTPGRFQVWEKILQGQQRPFPSEQAPLLDELREDFQKILDGKAPYSPSYADNWDNWGEWRLKLLRKTILSSFLIRDTGKLLLITDNLSKANKIEPFPLLCLAMGLLNELKKDWGESLDWYNRAIELGDTVDKLYLEDILRRVTSISITQQDYDNGVLALQCLVDLCISYAPQYAHLLTLIGDTDSALDVYADYLARVPKDIKAMLQLGNVYKQLALPEGMLFAADHVLEISKENKSARQLKLEAEQLLSTNQ